MYHIYLAPPMLFASPLLFGAAYLSFLFWKHHIHSPEKYIDYEELSLEIPLEKTLILPKTPQCYQREVNGLHHQIAILREELDRQKISYYQLLENYQNETAALETRLEPDQPTHKIDGKLWYTDSSGKFYRWEQVFWQPQ